MITIIDYGVGNLFSLSSSLSYLGLENKVSRDPEDLRKADHIILPGVGAYGDAIAKLRGSGMAEPLLDEAKAGKPIMGICLGMQLLFDKSYEYGEHQGLGLIPGVMADLKEDIPANLKVPHMGWNSLHLTEKERSIRCLNTAKRAITSTLSTASMEKIVMRVCWQPRSTAFRSRRPRQMKMSWAASFIRRRAGKWDCGF